MKESMMLGLEAYNNDEFYDWLQKYLK